MAGFGRTPRAGKTYRLFISHAWAYGDSYTRIVAMLDAAPRFRWANYSAPANRPVVDARTAVGKRLIRAELADQIRPVGCVIVLAGMYASYREWIQAEIDIAVNWHTPILGVRPRGAQRTPAAVASAADEMVAWSTASVVSAVRRLSA